MLAPDEKLKLSPKPYLSATPGFAGGADTPRDFLERCLADLAALEPKIGAFVNLNLAGARSAADRATVRWREGRPLSKIDGMEKLAWMRELLTKTGNLTKPLDLAKLTDDGPRAQALELAGK